MFKYQNSYNHRNNNIIEIKPREEEKGIIAEVIRDYGNKLEAKKAERQKKNKRI